MFRFAGLAGAVLLSGNVWCQPTKAPTAEFKGLAMGASYDEVAAAIGKAIDCPAKSPKPSNSTCMYGGGTYAAEVLDDLRISFIKGRLAKVWMTMNPDRFDRVIVAMRQKYGNGVVSGEKLQNGYGAKFEQLTVSWSFPDGSSIYAMKYVNSTTSVVGISSAEENKRLADLRAKQKPPSADL